MYGNHVNLYIHYFKPDLKYFCEQNPKTRHTTLHGNMFSLLITEISNILMSLDEEISSAFEFLKNFFLFFTYALN